jgi:hypothetical protein
MVCKRISHGHRSLSTGVAELAGLARASVGTVRDPPAGAVQVVQMFEQLGLMVPG